MNTRFFESLIDDFGIWQHTDGKEILREEGYALDDAARGFLACVALKRTDQMEVLFRYLQMSNHDGSLYGFCTAKREFITYPSSQDAFGQTVWALGTAVEAGFHADDARAMLKQLQPSIDTLSVWRGYAYALLGAVKYDLNIADELADKLVAVCDVSGGDWLWPDQTMTYAIGILPYALLEYAAARQDKSTADLAVKLLNFIESVTHSYGQPEPIGNEGWYSHGDVKIPRFSQQPIEPAYMVWAYTAAGRFMNEEKYFIASDSWFDWYAGNNPASHSMIDAQTGACYDGIDEIGINYHSGAEANICYILASWSHKNRQTI